MESIARKQRRKKDDKKYRESHREQIGEYGKKYKAAHREQRAEEDRKYRSTHQEQINEHSRKYVVTHQKQINEYRATHREQANERQKENYRNNKQKCSERVNNWLHTHPEKRIEYHERRRALKMRAEGDGVTAKQWLNLQEKYNYLCAYCGQKRPLTMDHIVPLSKGGRHDIDNVTPACKSCNSSKHNSSLLEFLSQRTCSVV